MHAHIHICMYVCKYVSMYVCMCVCTYVRTYVRMYVCMCCIRTCMHVYMLCTYVCKHVRHSVSDWWPAQLQTHSTWKVNRFPRLETAFRYSTRPINSSCKKSIALRGGSEGVLPRQFLPRPLRSLTSPQLGKVNPDSRVVDSCILQLLPRVMELEKLDARTGRS